MLLTTHLAQTIRLVEILIKNSCSWIVHAEQSQRSTWFNCPQLYWVHIQKVSYYHCKNNLRKVPTLENIYSRNYKQNFKNPIFSETTGLILQFQIYLVGIAKVVLEKFKMNLIHRKEHKNTTNMCLNFFYVIFLDHNYTTFL